MDQCINKVVAFDFGASSGRAMIASLDQGKIALEEIHRFSNDPVYVGDTLHWDVLRLLHEIKTALLKVKDQQVLSLGIDTWGVDFGLLDLDGKLIENPIHYRDQRTNGMLEESFRLIDKEEFYWITGNQFMEINTAFQVLSLKKNRSHLLERAKTLLMMPDLLNYFLCGEKVTEYTIASTTQLLDTKQREWSPKVMSSLELPARLFAPIIPCGTKLSTLTKEIQEELELAPIAVTAVAGHDTQCAIAAVPALTEDFVFLSCGTWSLLGTEISEPIMSDLAYRYNITNEGAFNNRYSFLKNITGLWLVQESRRQYKREGKDFSFSELEQLGLKATPLQSFIDVDAPEFSLPGNLPQRIREYCIRTNQYIPQNEGEIIRCINESLAMRYRQSLDEIKECTGKEYQELHMVGGGIQSKMLCQCAANACGCNVIAGPIEATVLGNAVIQYMSLGVIKDIKEARTIIRNSYEMEVYHPLGNEEWEAGYQRFLWIVKNNK
jgi:rhamnulokinase/L-fuculokinase